MFSRRRSTFRVVPLDLEQVRALPPLPSGYCTDRVYRLSRAETGNTLEWRLMEERLQRPITKTYDDGVGASWLSSYADAGAPESLRFLAAELDGVVQGLATWTVSNWNSSLWLVDIRVLPESRGTGVGSALIDALADRCSAEALRGIAVETQIGNYPAVRFYRKRGFAISGFNDHLYTNDDLALGDAALYLFLETDEDR